MKGALAAAGTAIIFGAILLVRPGESRVLERRVPVAVKEVVPVEVPVPVERVRTEVQVIEKTVHTSRAEERSALPPSCDRMLFLFERELRLTGEQRRHMESVLKEREGRIESYNAHVRSSGVFSRRAYSRRIREIRAESYGWMAEVLDASQLPRFRELIAAGRLGDAVAFRIDPNLVVLD